jgi:hypothetical protein
MASEQDTPDNIATATSKSPTVQRVEHLPPSEPKPATEAELQKVEKEMTGFERATLKWTRASFYIVLATCFFIGLQWHEMNVGGTDTHTLAEAAKKQADKSETISTSVAQAVTELKTTADTTKKSVETLQRQIRLDQRPWIKFDLGDGSDQFHWRTQVGAPMQFPIRFTNTGKTPAKHVLASIYLKIIPKDTMPRLPVYPKGQEIPKGSIKEALVGFDIAAGRIFAGSHVNQTVGMAELVGGHAREKVLSVSDANDLVQKRSFLLMYGRIVYYDGFGTEHWSIFCNAAFIDGSSANLPKCANFADDDNN